MSLEIRIAEDLKSAMRAKDQSRMRAIRAIKAAILLKKTDGSGSQITEEDEIKLLQKLVKSRRESLDIYQKQNREDLAKIEREEIEVISEYLPAPLSDAELGTIIDEIIAEQGATSMKDMGRVMGLVNQKVAGKADGRKIAEMVKGKLG